MSHPSPEELLEIRDGAGTMASRRHVDGCPACAAEIRSLKETASLLRALPRLEPRHDQWPEIREALEAEERRWSPRAVVGTIVALAASLMILAIFPVADSARAPVTLQGEETLARSPITDGEIEQLVRESQRLEGLLRRAGTRGAVTDGWRAYTVADLQDRIALVDAELADEGSRRISSTKRARLWRVRVGLMNDLVRARAEQPQYVEF